MSWGAVAGAAAGVVGGMMQADAATEAARLQSEAGKAASNAALTGTRESNQLTADIYKNQLRTGAPAVQGGQLALSALMSGMGLGSARAAPGAGGGYRSPTARAPVGAFTNALGQAVDAQGNVMSSTDYGISDLNYGATQDQLSGAATPFEGAFTEQFTGQDIYQDPSYKWRLEQGNAALKARQAAGGNRWGSQAMKDIQDYAQGAASTEYGAAYDRFQKNKSLLFDRLSGIAGIGTAAGNAGSAAGSSAAGQISGNTMAGVGASNDYLTGAAASNAAGRVGSTNAIVGGINQGLNTGFTMDYLRGNRASPGGGGYSGTGNYTGPVGAGYDTFGGFGG